MVNYKSRTVSIVALPGNRRRRPRSNWENPESQVLLTAGGRFALAINEGSASVTAINIKTHKKHTTTVGKEPRSGSGDTERENTVVMQASSRRPECTEFDRLGPVRSGMRRIPR